METGSVARGDRGRIAGAFRAWRAALASAAADQRAALLLWLPVAMGVGIATYFALPIEPPFALALVLLGAVAAGAILAPRSARPWAALVLAGAAGLAVATFRTALVGAPILSEEIGPARIEAVVLAHAQRRDGSRRLLLRPQSLGDLATPNRPDRVRVTVRTEAPPLQPGDRVGLLAMLTPPPGPAAPGDFDFARQAYFERLGAVGYAVSDVERLGRASPGVMVRLQAMREGVADRIRAVLNGEVGAVAVALSTGLRDGLPEETVQALRAAGLAHLLAISGLHVGLVAATLVFLGRFGLALWPHAALHWPIKALAAGMAWAGAGGYVLLAGATVPTVRAFVMVSLSLLALMAGRRPFSLRLVAVAALVILFLRPEALVSAGFQMSFAAVVALVAVFDRYGAAMAAWRQGQSRVRRLALYFLAVLISTIVAELAIAPFAAFQFHRVGFYGLAANMVAVPLMSLWIMPLALAGLLLMPLGLEALALVPLGWGLDVVLQTAHSVASWPGAETGVPAFPAFALGLMAMGGLMAAIVPRRAVLPLAGGLFAIGLVIATMSGRPDLFVDRDGRVAAWAEDGRLLVSHPRRGAYDRDRWRHLSGFGPGQADDPRDVAMDRASDQGVPLHCDPMGCAWRRNGQWVVVSFGRSGLPLDCRRADVLVAFVPVRPPCPAPRIIGDLADVRAMGALAIDLDAEPPRLESAAGVRGARPWVRPHPARD